MDRYGGAHPAIGALDVCPLVWLDRGDRDAARTEAVAVATQIGGLGVPVFLYGELAHDPARAERAYFRNGGLAELWLRMESGELRPDFGPGLPHPRGGATLVTARPPLAAFNVELDSGDVEVARAVAAGLRESGGGPAGGAGDRPAALQRPRPGLDQRPRPAGGAAGRRWSRRCGSWRRRSAPGRSRPSWSGWSRRRRWPGIPADVPMRGFDPGTARDRATASRASHDRAKSSRFTPWPRRRKSAAASAAAPRAAGSTPRPAAGRPRSREEAESPGALESQQAERAQSRSAADLAQLGRSAASSPPSSSPCC